MIFSVLDVAGSQLLGGTDIFVPFEETGQWYSIRRLCCSMSCGCSICEKICPGDKGEIFGRNWSLTYGKHIDDSLKVHCSPSTLHNKRLITSSVVGVSGEDNLWPLVTRSKVTTSILSSCHSRFTLDWCSTFFGACRISLQSHNFAGLKNLRACELVVIVSVMTLLSYATECNICRSDLGREITSAKADRNFAHEDRVSQAMVTKKKTSWKWSTRFWG